MFFPAQEWFAAFVLTALVETVVLLALLRPRRTEVARLALLVLFANLATHPIVWYVLSQPFLVGTIEYLVVAESWAIAAEAVLYAVTIPGLGQRRALGISFVANVASFLAGQAVGWIWPWAFG